MINIRVKYGHLSRTCIEKCSVTAKCVHLASIEKS